MIKYKYNVVIFLLVFILMALSQTIFAFSKKTNSILTISSNEIKPGMKGYGLTVFKGTKPERFEVEVVSVVPNFLLRQNIILIKCFHPVTDKAGVIGGMSGSPIYIEGKLAGALSYGWRFSKEPIAGVTPIKDMLDVLKRKLRVDKDQKIFKSNFAQLLSPFFLNKKYTAQPTKTFYTRMANQSVSKLTPAKTPLTLSGFWGKSRSLMEDILSPYGIEPMLGGGNGSLSKDPKKFVPGGAIGVQLIRGDMSATGIGTVTTVQNKNVLAFGHPMFNMGQGFLPVTTAQIHTVIASLSRSNKLGSPLGEIGSLIQDRQSCIVARTDRRAQMIPVTISINDKRSKFKETYKIEVAAHKLLASKLTKTALVNVIQHAVSDATDVTAQIKGHIKVAGHKALTIFDSGISRTGLISLIGYFRPTSIVALILNNPFEDTMIESINYDIELSYGLNLSRIVGVYLTTQNPSPLDMVNLHIRLKSYGGKEHVMAFPIQIPAGTENKKIQIVVAGGDYLTPNIAPPQNLKDILNSVTKFYSPKSLVVSINVPGQGVALKGHLLNDLPDFAISALKPTVGIEQIQSYKNSIRQIHSTQMLIAGKEVISLTVGNRRNK